MKTNRLKIWKNERIVFYYNHADASFWDAEWENVITKDYYKKYEAGNLDEIGYFFEKYFRKDDFILEAGCGTAQYVVALLARGFHNIEGIDWGQKTINTVKAIYPDLPVYVGNVMKIEKEDNYYDGYVSLGVVEHRELGPEPYLDEAYRVLKPGGYAIITVPYINSLRCIKGRLGFYRNAKNISAKNFYQYAFNKKEFSDLLEKTGFSIIESRGIAGYFGLIEELPALFRFFDRIPGGWKIKQWLKRVDAIQFSSHMIIFVCQKKY